MTSPLIDLPPLTALFLVTFDPKIGYKTSWSRTSLTLPEAFLEGVEYKCLPSGLHGVGSDVVYFLHGNDSSTRNTQRTGHEARNGNEDEAEEEERDPECYAGVAAFHQAERGVEERGAVFVSVGALVEVGRGRLGRAWMWAEELGRLARGVVETKGRPGTESTRELDRVWERCGRRWPGGERKEVDGHGEEATAAVEERGGERHSSDTASALAQNAGMMLKAHPALDMGALFETFGPLLFPLYRASLCRRRILLLGKPPVQRSCNFGGSCSVLTTMALLLLATPRFATFDIIVREDAS